MSDPVTKTIYLDHAATTPLDPAVLAVMLPHLEQTYGNPSSIHHVGRAAYDTVFTARQSVANQLAVEPDEIIFTSGGTESDNLAIIGLAMGRRQHGEHVIVSAIEHKAVLAAAQKLETEGFEITYLPVNADGLVSLDTLRAALRNDTILVSIMYANNEIGTIQPIREIADALTERYTTSQKPVFHTDACQAPGFLPLTPAALGVDALTLNGSKMYGPKGIGLLYLRRSVSLDPQIIGGSQEFGQRAGTESVALITGFAKALQLAQEDTQEAGRLAALRDSFLSNIQTQIPDIILNGHPTKRLPNNLHFCIPEIEGEALILLLDHAGICAATGSACNASDLEPSHVLSAIGRDDEIIHGSLRLTLGHSTTETDLRYTSKIVTEAVARLRTISCASTNPIHS